MYNFLGLVNELCAKVNEVPLSSSNFVTSEGFYQTCKDGINRAIDDINLESHFWRFNFQTNDSPLVAGQMRYNWPATAAVVDFDSFRIKQSQAFNTLTRRLVPLNYDDYLQNWVDKEYDVNETTREQPRFIVKTPGDDYIVVPNPDQAYDVVFDYYTHPERLEGHDEVPNVPERYRNVLITGALRDVYMFREDEFSSTMMVDKFTKQVGKMRTREINLYDYVRSGARLGRNFTKLGGLHYVK